MLYRLSHEAIVRYHVFTIDQRIGRPYLAMEFVDGQSLFDLMSTSDFDRGCLQTLPSPRLRAECGHERAPSIATSRPTISSCRAATRARQDHRLRHCAFATIGGETVIGGSFAGKYNYVSPEQLGLFGGDVRSLRHLQPWAGAGRRVRGSPSTWAAPRWRSSRSAKGARPVRHRRRFSAADCRDAAAGSGRPASQHGRHRPDDARRHARLCRTAPNADCPPRRQDDVGGSRPISIRPDLARLRALHSPGASVAGAPIGRRRAPSSGRSKFIERPQTLRSQPRRRWS